MVTSGDPRGEDTGEALASLAADPAAPEIFSPVGERWKNVGITAFSVRRYPFDRDRYEVMIELTSASPDVEEVELGRQEPIRRLQGGFD